jgi:biopolymer transport protein ExbD
MNNTLSLTSTMRRAKPISLTALIDVVFILLMFFMLTSSFSQWQILDLNSASANDQAKKAAPPVLVVYENEFGLLTDTMTRPIALNKVVSELVDFDLSQTFIISGQDSVQLSRLIETYEALQQQGFLNIQIGQSISEKK